MDQQAAKAKATTIIVNTRRHLWDAKEISYEQLVALAYPGETPNDEVAFTVRYSRGHGGHGSGTLTAGESVRVQDGMVCDVTRTTRS